MERFDDVSVVASVDESPPPRQVSRRTRRAFTAVVATVVATGALAGAAVGLADEKAEPSQSAAPASQGWMKYSDGKRGECRGKHFKQSQSSAGLRY
jgi:hypothetical protein